MILGICKPVINIINKKVQEIIVVCCVGIYKYKKYQVPNEIHKLQKVFSFSNKIYAISYFKNDT